MTNKEPAQARLNNEQKIVENKKEFPKQKRINYKKKLLAVQQELEIVKDQYLRALAEFDNYKKRRDRDFFNLVESANMSLIEALLPILDDFDWSFNSTSKGKSAKSFKKGIELIYEKFRNILEKQGLKYIEAKGKPFDPDLHEAIMQVETKGDQPSNIVVDEALKGYKFKDKMLRHSKVVVST